MISLVDVAGDVVLPAVRAVFDEAEVSAIHIDQVREASFTLVLTAEGETFHDYVVQGDVEGWTSEDWRERLRSNLADFVAESRFGWGQNRETRRS